MNKKGFAAIRLRGVDWFSWATGGGNSVVLLTSEVGVGEVLITLDRAWVLTNRIEKNRLRAEEVPPEFEVWDGPWHKILEKTVSDRPTAQEEALPPEIMAAKRRLSPEEILRYRQLGREAAEAMTATLGRARPEWSELQLAGEGAKALWERGIHPALILAGGEERACSYRHPFPTPSRLGSHAMLVFCARKYGLYANLTRWVYFREPTSIERQKQRKLAQIEAAAFRASQPGSYLHEIYQTLTIAYAQEGFPGEEQNHHQGGTTGYLSREVIATPSTQIPIEENTALAWNPSLPSAKIEDTVLSQIHGLEILTQDPQWPTFLFDGRRRPDYLILS